MNSFVRVRKNKHSDVIINVDLAALFNWPKKLLKTSLNFLVNTVSAGFQFLELIYQKKLLLSLAGLGLGFGFSLIVGQSPSASFATNSLTDHSQTITIEKISLPKYFVETRVGRKDQQKPICLTDQAQHLSGSLTDWQKSIVISGCSNLAVFGQFKDLNLGEEIVLIGSNDGRYHYRVIEIRIIDIRALPSLIQSNSPAVVLYTPTDLFATQFLVVMAKS